MEFFAGLLTVGGLFFWLFAALVVIGLTSSVHNEKPGVGFILVIAALVALQFTSDFKPFTWVMANPGLFGLGVLAYIGIAVVWTFAKWYMFSVAAKECYADFRKTWIENLKRPFDVVTDKAALASSFGNFYGYRQRFGNAVPPSPSENKGRIMLWMIFWPIDMIWSTINDPVVRIFRWIYQRIAGSLSHIARGRFTGFEELK